MSVTSHVQFETSFSLSSLGEEEKAVLFIYKASVKSLHTMRKVGAALGRNNRDILVREMINCLMLKGPSPTS